MAATTTNTTTIDSDVATIVLGDVALPYINRWQNRAAIREVWPDTQSPIDKEEKRRIRVLKEGWLQTAATIRKIVGDLEGLWQVLDHHVTHAGGPQQQADRRRSLVPLGLRFMDKCANILDSDINYPSIPTGVVEFLVLLKMRMCHGHTPPMMIAHQRHRVKAFARPFFALLSACRSVPSFMLPGLMQSLATFLSKAVEQSSSATALARCMAPLIRALPRASVARWIAQALEEDYLEDQGEGAKVERKWWKLGRYMQDVLFTNDQVMTDEMVVNAATLAYVFTPRRDASSSANSSVRWAFVDAIARAPNGSSLLQHAFQTLEQINTSSITPMQTLLQLRQSNRHVLRAPGMLELASAAFYAVTRVDAPWLERWADEFFVLYKGRWMRAFNNEGQAARRQTRAWYEAMYAKLAAKAARQGQIEWP